MANSFTINYDNSTGNGTTWYFTYPKGTSTLVKSGDVVYLDWGEPYEPKIKDTTDKCSVQEPPRKKNIRFLNRSS